MFAHGDLVFSQIGTDANAISAVTEGFKGARVNHMGVVVENPKGMFILEAFPPEVRVTQIDVFLRRSADPLNGRQRYLVSRLKAAHRHLIASSIKYGLNQRNIPYDDLYLTDSAALYCSELVVDMFRYANGGQEFFPEHAMSFRDLATGEIHPIWIEYYAKFGMEVPEGQPGSNPGTISKDSRLDLVTVQGPPAGYSGA
jgi:Permuted papain-like amidase enzyme, YaeF/YiiX, C92 family